MGGQIIGNAARIAQLRKIIAEDKFPHAVIFAGVAGIGKRLIAESCAAAILCESPSAGAACGECESCKLLAAGSHPDFSVVAPEESKSTPSIKIAQIRALQEATAVQPMRSERRVVIIDGAELMNNAAANCLLKTLEEPTGQTIFVLVTTNRAGLLMTVRSRCVTVNFEKLSAAEIATALVNRGVEKSRAETVSLIADGSLGRALRLENSGGYELRESALEFIEKLCAKKITVEDIFSRGAEVDKWSRENFGEFVGYVQKILRDVYLLDAAEPFNADLKARLGKLKIPAGTLYELFEAGTETQRRLRSNAALRLLAEAYFMRLRLAFAKQ